MIIRVDRIAIDLPEPKGPDANAAATIQELLGGRFGEMSTFMNYTFQSFNFRGRDQARPFYDLIANIAAEEFGHMELVSYAINLLLTGASERGTDPTTTPLKDGVDARNTYHYIASGQTALPIDSMGNPWTGQNVFSSGNLKLDLLHNFHLECGARLHKLRVYETLTDPLGREVCGYLLVRGSVHAHAYALAIKQITGVEIEKMLPTPNINLDRIPESQKYLAEGSHRRLYRFSPDDYKEMSAIWGNGEQALPGDPPGELEVVDGYPEGGKIHDLTGVASAFAPDYAPEEMFEIAKKLYEKSR